MKVCDAVEALHIARNLHPARVAQANLQDCGCEPAVLSLPYSKLILELEAVNEGNRKSASELTAGNIDALHTASEQSEHRHLDCARESAPEKRSTQREQPTPVITAHTYICPR